jgi:hypothetical protein
MRMAILLLGSEEPVVLFGLVAKGFRRALLPRLSHNKLYPASRVKNAGSSFLVYTLTAFDLPVMYRACSTVATTPDDPGVTYSHRTAGSNKVFVTGRGCTI